MIRHINIKGFTLIEFILVISIVGVISIVAIPKYLNLSSTAQINSTKYIAATLTTANSENYAVRIISASNGLPVTNCVSVANLLVGGLPAGYRIINRSVKVNATVNCTLRGPSSTSAKFLATGIR